ncbi:MAG: hypothetical protein HYZ47_00705, partial [Simkania negevensis]|nr:hypothetical protein [Simkania negevensis]
MNDLISSEGCGVCLAPGDSVNHLDHLAVIAYIMDVPMITDEEKILATLQKYYPQVKPLYIPQHERIIEFFAQNFDFLFVSSANYRRDLSPLFHILFRKEMLFWFCPHGNSDKPMHQFQSQHLSLIYGDQMEDRLKEENILPKIQGVVKTGNYRFPFYKKYETFYDDLVEKEIFSKFAKKQPIILYAPTWEDLENSSSLFEISLPLLD